MLKRQKQPFTVVLKRRCSENIRQIYKRTHSCRSVISVKFLHFIEITLRHGRSTVNLLHVRRVSFTKITSGWLLLDGIMLFGWNQLYLKTSTTFKTELHGEITLRKEISYWLRYFQYPS